LYVYKSVCTVKKISSTGTNTNTLGCIPPQQKEQRKRKKKSVVVCVYEWKDSLYEVKMLGEESAEVVARD